MTEAEIYEFDLNGYILYRDLIPAGDLRRMNETIDTVSGREQSWSFLFPRPGRHLQRRSGRPLSALQIHSTRYLQT